MQGEWVTDDEGEEEQSFVEVNAKKLAPKVNLSDFELRRVIGKGAFGKVFLVRKIMGEDTGKMFAMKVLRKASLILLENKDKTRSERTILERLAHPFIVRLHYAFQTQGKLYLILQYASGGELFSYLQEDTLLEDTARFYLAELLLAIEHIHSLGIVYRDLKPENILLDGRGHLLLTDFGLSKVGLDESDGKTQTFCGTVDYMAPETLESQRYGKVVDWWSFGALMYDMLVGMPPFSGNSRSQTMDNIVQGKLTIPNYLSADAKDLIRRLLKKNPEGRLGFHGAEEIRRHPFFKKISWEDVRNLAATPPIVPSLAGEEDVKYFDPSFTTQPVVDTPDDGFFHLTDSSQELFKGFSYIGPSLLSPR